TTTAQPEVGPMSRVLLAHRNPKVDHEPQRPCSDRPQSPGACTSSEKLRNEPLETMAITIYGVIALSYMMAMYALEHRDRAFIAAFAAGCLLSSAYGFLSGAWPFGVVEAVWAIIAFRRFAGNDQGRSHR